MRPRCKFPPTLLRWEPCRGIGVVYVLIMWQQCWLLYAGLEALWPVPMFGMMSCCVVDVEGCHVHTKRVTPLFVECSMSTMARGLASRKRVHFCGLVWLRWGNWRKGAKEKKAVYMHCTIKPPNWERFGIRFCVCFRRWAIWKRQAECLLNRGDYVSGFHCTS